MHASASASSGTGGLGRGPVPLQMPGLELLQVVDGGPHLADDECLGIFVDVAVPAVVPFAPTEVKPSSGAGRFTVPSPARSTHWL